MINVSKDDYKPRVILLTCLGDSKYEEVTYSYKENTARDKFATIAILKLLNNQSQPFPGQIYVFTTKEAFKSQFDDFEQRLKALPNSSSFTYENITITSQQNEEEIHNNFHIFVENLKDNDIIYADITNSFRSIPVILLSAIERARATKNIQVRGIFYGTFKKNNFQNEQMIDLLPFQQFNEWSYQIRQFLKTGYYNNENKNLQVNAIETLLTSFSKAIYFPSRIFAMENALKIKELLELEKEGTTSHLLNAIPDFLPILQHKLNFQNFSNIGSSKNYIYNIALIVELCFSFQLNQSAITFCHENLRAILLEQNDDIDYGHWYAIQKSEKAYNIIQKKIKNALENNPPEQFDKKQYKVLTTIRNKANHASTIISNSITSEDIDFFKELNKKIIVSYTPEETNNYTVKNDIDDSFRFDSNSFKTPEAKELLKKYCDNFKNYTLLDQIALQRQFSFAPEKIGFDPKKITRFKEYKKIKEYIANPSHY